ncbi:MAG: hypothetical protein LBC83_01090 [Oscillospiraceae bacterium]|jgi:hypothetical protein|nr:hypothetical protein [Oscillospiraceae bacterium]
MERDEDIRIFTGVTGAAAADLDALAQETEAQRQSGQLGKAKQLGRDLATFSARSPELVALAQSFGFTPCPEWEQHLHVLMLFSAQTALRELLTPELLAEAALTTMNNTLINREKAFWDTVSDGRIFTQYMLALRGGAEKQDSARARVGAVFAQVCGQEDNPDLRELGATVFETAHKWIAAQL